MLSSWSNILRYYQNIQEWSHVVWLDAWLNREWWHRQRKVSWPIPSNQPDLGSEWRRQWAVRPPIADDWSRLHKSPTETDGRQVYKQLADTPTASCVNLVSAFDMQPQVPCFMNKPTPHLESTNINFKLAYVLLEIGKSYKKKPKIISYVILQMTSINPDWITGNSGLSRYTILCDRQT